MQRPSSSGHNDSHSRRHRQQPSGHVPIQQPGASLGMPNFKYRQQHYDVAPKSQATFSFQERLESKLSQNVALLLVDKNYESIENQAHFALTSLMKEFLVEIGKEIKNTSEMQGRTDANLIDGLNTAFDYDMSQENIRDYIEREKTSDKN